MPAGITETDSMFSVREVPWHGLGAVLDDYPTGVEDALAKSGLDWKVELHPVFVGPDPIPEDRDDDSDPIKLQRAADARYEPRFRSSVRADNGELLGLVGEDYTVVQNEEAFRFLDDIINSDVHFETAGSLFGGRRVWVLARLPEFIEVGGDPTGTYLYVATSHEGSLSVTAAVTPIRIVCQNTLSLALGSARRTYKFRHAGNLQTKFDEARQALELTINYEKQFQTMGNKLAKAKLSVKRFDDSVVKPLVGLTDDEVEDLGDRAKTLREAQRDALIQIFRGDGPNGDTTGNIGGTKWMAVNAVAEYADWGRRYTKRTNQVARSFEDHDLKQRALELVLEA